MADEASIQRCHSRQVRFRFRLRTFLIAIALIAAGFGLLGRELARLNKQRAIVSDLVSSGASVAFDYQVVDSRVDLSRSTGTNPLRWVFGNDMFTEATFVQWATPSASDDLVAQMSGLSKVANVMLCGPKVTDKAVSYLRRLQLLEGLNLMDVGLSADGMAQLSKCPKLKYITLIGSFVTDAHLKALQFGPKLRELQIIRAPNVTDAGVSNVESLDSLEYLDFYSVPKIGDLAATSVARLSTLKSLNFLETSITDAGLRDIGKLRRLERLGLKNHPIHDDGIRALSDLKSIRSLQLSDTKISDAALSTISEFHDLEELDLSGTSITDAGLEMLANMPKLTSLQLLETGITNEGLNKLRRIKSLRNLGVTLGPDLTLEKVQHLKQSLPACKIECYQSQSGGGAVLETTE